MLIKAINETLSDSQGVARASKLLGQCYHETGEYSLALTLHEKAARIRGVGRQ